MFDHLPLFELIAGLGVFLLVIGASDWLGKMQDDVVPIAHSRLPRHARGNAVLRAIASRGAQRAGRDSVVDQRMLRLLKQADWLWVAGEPGTPRRESAFWDVETMWAEKHLSAVTYGAAAFAAGWLLLTTGVGLDAFTALAGAVAFTGAAAYLGWSAPDAAVQGAAAQRQRTIALEMGYRLPELRSDVLAGRTIMSALRELAERPGGAFVEEVRRVIFAFDVVKDEAEALAVMLDRNASNEMVSEFVNQMTMAVSNGNEVSRVLDVLASAAQQRLLQQIAAQGRRNAQEMGRPLAAGSVLIMALLIMLPASFTIGAAMF
jgi:hypothetical protein